MAVHPSVVLMCDSDAQLAEGWARQTTTTDLLQSSMGAVGLTVVRVVN